MTIDFKAIQKEVRETAELFKNNGWKGAVCDNYAKDHFLKSGASSLYEKGDQMLCRNCLKEKLK